MRKAVTLLELLITIIILGILITSLVMAGTAIYDAGANAREAVPMSRLATALDNIFARHLRGETNNFTILDNGQRVEFPFYHAGLSDARRVAIYFEDGRIFYDRDVTDQIDASDPELIADNIASIEFSDQVIHPHSTFAHTENARRLGVDIELVSGERIVTSVVARHLGGRTVID